MELLYIIYLFYKLNIDNFDVVLKIKILINLIKITGESEDYTLEIIFSL